MEQANVEWPTPARPEPTVPTIEVCVGRCCRAHSPSRAEQKRRLHCIEQMIQELGGELLRPACLGQCLRQRVLVAHRQVEGEFEVRWLAGLTVGAGLEELAAWMKGVESPPVEHVLATATFDETDETAGCHCGDPLPNT